MTEYQPELLPPQPLESSPAQDALRADARARLAEMLQDPRFRATEGFPLGADEDILALSDPPYYTACPNPFLAEIIASWQQEREALRQQLGLTAGAYQREPFAADVSEGKNDPIYNAHSYHTKVPHKAIMRYILHYTDPGDIVFDGFCGTGMTGVAAQLCGDRQSVTELGYRVDDQGLIWEGSKAISHLGARKAVLNDLSPAATFIAYNYNTPVDTAAFEREARQILQEVEQECGWMYETWHPNCDDPRRVKARINYTVWSEVFICPQCGSETIFWDVAVNREDGEIISQWRCPGCQTWLSKNPPKNSDALRAEHSMETLFDPLLGSTVRRTKLVPVQINYSFNKKKIDKCPDREDIFLAQRIEDFKLPYNVPTQKMLFKDGAWGDQWRAGAHEGISNVHHFYTKRGLILSSVLHNATAKIETDFLRKTLTFWVQSVSLSFTRLNRYLKNAFSQVNRQRSGTLYVPSLVSDISPQYALNGKISRLTQIFKKLYNFNKQVAGGTGSSTDLRSMPNSSIEYIFVDPPFGDNLMYSELNFIWEAWLNIFTRPSSEAVVSETQQKGLSEYQNLMSNCYKEFYRILKPGYWITVEFHNSRNTVWNAIQEALLNAGFVVADVRTFDKQQGSFNQVNSTGSVKQDLIISAYKPNGNLENRFQLKAGTEDGVWEFVRYHLGKLPILNQHEDQLIANAERQAFLLFDRMVAFHIQRGVMVPISAPEFYAGLEQRFTRRDGMYFLPEQVTEYDRALIDSKGVVQLAMFVTDEKTAIQWLRQQLDPNTGGQPQTHANLNPKFKLVLHQAKHEKAPELIEILEQNFLQDEAAHWFLPDPNKASDLERVRQRALLREFGEYAANSGRLRQFRTEAVRAGFVDAYKRQEYDTIIQIAARLPEDVLREDPDLLMYFDSATLRKK